MRDARAAAAAAVTRVQGAVPSLSKAQEKDLLEDLQGLLMWRLVRALIVDGNQNNMGAVTIPRLKTTDGKPVTLFRSGFTPAPALKESCVRSLTEAGGVRHTVNLYSGPLPTVETQPAAGRLKA